jgi:hypothetical protein
MGGRNRCAGGDLKPLKVGLRFQKELINGFLRFGWLEAIVKQEEIKRMKLYGQDKWLEQK